MKSTDSSRFSLLFMSMSFFHLICIESLCTSQGVWQENFFFNRQIQEIHWVVSQLQFSILPQVYHTDHYSFCLLIYFSTFTLSCYSYISCHQSGRLVILCFILCKTSAFLLSPHKMITSYIWNNFNFELPILVLMA